MEDRTRHGNLIRISELSRQNIYDVPVGFFDELETGIKKECAAKSKRFHPRQWKRWAELSLAASILIALTFSGAKLLFKRYQPVETHRMIFTIADGDGDRETIPRE